MTAFRQSLEVRTCPIRSLATTTRSCALKRAVCDVNGVLNRMTDYNTSGFNVITSWKA